MNPEQVLERANQFFGPAGYGLAEVNRTATFGTWEGGGGAVWVTITPRDNRSIVEVSTREYDPQVREFLHKL